MEINLSVFKFCLQSALAPSMSFLAESALWDVSQFGDPSGFLPELLSSPMGFPGLQSTLSSAVPAWVPVRVAFAISCLDKALTNPKSMMGQGFRITTALEIKTRALNCQMWTGSPWKFWSALLLWPVPKAAPWAKHVNSHKDTAAALKSLTLENYALCELKKQQLVEVCWS